MNQEKIGKFISQLRKEKNMTQQELADKLSVSNKTVGNWENGRNMPDLSLFKPLCKELDIKADELLLGEKIENDINKKEKIKKAIKEIVNNNSKKNRNVKSILLDLFTDEVLENEISTKEKNKIKYINLLLIIILIFCIFVCLFFIKFGKNNWLTIFH